MQLFKPITIRGMELRNRIVFPSVQLDMGLANRRARAFYTERARGGAGLVLTGALAIDSLACEELWGGAEGLQAFVERLHAFTDQVHEAGARIGLQLWQGNRFPTGKEVHAAGRETNAGSGDSVAPSARENMRELTVSEIESIIYRFSKAARNARAAGFDCVEIHGAHGYLPCQFASPEHNKRNDKYGGDLAGRMKFGIDLVTSVRAWIGLDFPLLFRLGAMDDNGIIHPDSISYAEELEKAGVDCLDISTSGWGRIPPSPPRRFSMGTLVFLAAAIKKNVKIPVITVGRINTPEIAEEILTSEQADLVAIGRQLIADPFWPKKIMEGRRQEIIVCDSCNINCFSTIEKRRLPEGAPLCKLNERVGREWEMPPPE